MPWASQSSDFSDIQAQSITSHQYVHFRTPDLGHSTDHHKKMTFFAGILTYAWPFAKSEGSLIAVAVIYGYVVLAPTHLPNVTDNPFLAVHTG